VDGIEATRRIKAADPTARIVIVTDYDDDALHQAAIGEGACGYRMCCKNGAHDLIGC
jgi:DNA-binding NarL/FixJ family response regulator